MNYAMNILNFTPNALFRVPGTPFLEPVTGGQPSILPAKKGMAQKWKPSLQSPLTTARIVSYAIRWLKGWFSFLRLIISSKSNSGSKLRRTVSIYDMNTLTGVLARGPGRFPLTRETRIARQDLLAQLAARGRQCETPGVRACQNKVFMKINGPKKIKLC
jgi:hypothetical protein